MRVEFNQGVPEGCIDWLWENVGQGNVPPTMSGPSKTFYPCDNDAWFYERAGIPNKDPKAEWSYVPTITVKDPKLAMLFALRWT